MITGFVQSSRGVTLLGGGEVAAEAFHAALQLAPCLVAADSGADRALALGQEPESVIGDLDSLSASARDLLGDRLLRIGEQETTDFEKALTRISAPLVLALGFSGGRMDHALAALSVLVRHPDRRCLLIGPEDFAFAAPPQLTLPTRAGDRVSLFPMGPCQAQATGLRWPLEGIAFAPDGRIGTSNEATGPITLDVVGPMLVILPLDLLRPVAEQRTGGFPAP